MGIALIVIAVICVIAAIMTARNKPGLRQAMPILLMVALVIGLADGLGFLSVEFRHNDHSEYYNRLTRAVDVAFALKMFTVVTRPVIALAFILEFVAYLISRSVLRREPGPA